MDGADPDRTIGDTLADLCKSKAKGATLTYSRVEEAILATCPDFGSSWGLEYVCGLVADGELPESAVAKALGRYRQQMRLAAAGSRAPIRAPANYLAVILRDELARYGLAWRKPERRRKEA